MNGILRRILISTPWRGSFVAAPASLWAVFSVDGALNQKEHPLEALTTRIYAEWFPSSGLEKSMDYEIQVYGPGNSESDAYSCELWIPVRKKS